MQTDEQGRYEVQGLDTGRYEISTRPSGFAPGKTSAPEYAEGFHTVDLTLDPARELLVQVVLPDGSPARGIVLRAFDQGSQRLEVEGRFQMLFDELSVGESGKARLRLLPAAPLTILAVRGDFYPAGKIAVDLTKGSPESVTIVMPTDGKAFGRNHYFQLQGPDGKPADVQGTATAESFLDGQLISRVEGRWVGKEFFFGHEGRNGFQTPMIAVGAPSGACTVVLTVPGYQSETLHLKADAVSPTIVNLRE